MAQGEKLKNRGSLIPVLTVLLSGMAIAAVLVTFTGVAGLFVLVALSGVLGFAALHYVLWGWWLSNWIRRQDDADGLDEGMDDPVGR